MLNQCIHSVPDQVHHAAAQFVFVAGHDQSSGNTPVDRQQPIRMFRFSQADTLLNDAGQVNRFLPAGVSLIKSRKSSKISEACRPQSSIMSSHSLGGNSFRIRSVSTLMFLIGDRRSCIIMLIALPTADSFSFCSKFFPGARHCE